MTPDAAAHERALSALHAQTIAAPGFGLSLATQWIEDGSAADILAAARIEMVGRVTLAQGILGNAVERPAAGASLHVWLPMSEIAAERVAARALRAGVEVTPPGAMILDGAMISGLRLCLGGALDRATLEQGLRTVQTALRDADTRRDIV